MNVTFRCFVCGISWPNTPGYRTCPICQEPSHHFKIDEGKDRPLTEREAHELLAERGLRPPLPPAEPTRLKINPLRWQRMREELHNDLERWAKEAPEWLHRH